jgi:hypothetical protein
MASRVAGSSHDSGSRTDRLGTTSWDVAGSSTSSSDSRPSSRVAGNSSGSKWTCSDRMPGVRSRIPDTVPSRRAASSRWCNACTRARRARSSTMSPYSTRTLSSPFRRYVTAGVPAAKPRASTPSSPSPRPVVDTIGEEAPRAAPSNPRDGASLARIGTNRTVSPGRNCPNFQRSAELTVTGQTNPPRLGPSGPSRIGVSPVKSSAPTE